MLAGALAAILMQAATPAPVTEIAPLSPAWSRSPGPDDMRRLHPDRARAQHLSGRVTLVCQVQADGGLARCSTEGAEPADAGFEAAALRASELFALPSASDVSVGASVKVPLYFALPSDVSAAPVSAKDPRVASGFTTLECRYRDRRLDNCFTPAPQPSAADKVALALAPGVTLPPTPRPEGRISLPLRFVGAPIEPAATGGPGSAITAPEWIRRPTGNDMARVYPQRAARSAVNGLATTFCGVTKAGTLTDCKVIEEAPGGAGFGEAALKLMPLFLMRPETRDGAPVEGGTVRIPIRFVVFH